MVFVIISAPSCRVAHAKIEREFQIILELVPWSLIQNVLWEVLSFHLGLKFSTFRLKVFCNEVVLDSAVDIQIKVNDLNSSGKKLVGHCRTLSWRRISQNIEGHIFEEKIHSTASKVDETSSKYSLSILCDCVIVQHLGDICETRR